MRKCPNLWYCTLRVVSAHEYFVCVVSSKSHNWHEMKWQRCLKSGNLSSSSGKPRTHHEERVTDPHAAPACGTLRDGDVLAVDCDGDGRSFAHRASAYVRFDLCLFNGHHGKRSRRRQPVGLIISAGVVTDVSGIAVEERHAVEPGETGARQTLQTTKKQIIIKNTIHTHTQSVR